MTRRNTHRRTIGATALAAILLPIAPNAKSDEPEESRVAPPKEIKSEVLLTLDGQPDEERSWFTQNLHLHPKSGMAFTRKFQVGDDPMVFQLQGPVLRKQKALGLTFRFRF